MTEEEFKWFPIDTDFGYPKKRDANAKGDEE